MIGYNSHNVTRRNWTKHTTDPEGRMVHRNRTVHGFYSARVAALDNVVRKIQRHPDATPTMLASVEQGLADIDVYPNRLDSVYSRLQIMLGQLGPIRRKRS